MEAQAENLDPFAYLSNPNITPPRGSAADDSKWQRDMEAFTAETDEDKTATARADDSADDSAFANAETVAALRPEAPKVSLRTTVGNFCRKVTARVCESLYVEDRRQVRYLKGAIYTAAGLAILLAGTEMKATDSTGNPNGVVQQDSPNQDVQTVEIPTDGATTPSTKPTIVEIVYKQSPSEQQATTPQPNVTVTVTKTVAGSTSPSAIASVVASASSSNSSQASASSSPSSNPNPSSSASPELSSSQAPTAPENSPEDSIPAPAPSGSAS
jgi:hypothetical protein